VFDLHSLRVTKAVNLKNRGVSIEAIQDLLGHQSQAMTWFYMNQHSSRTYAELQAAHSNDLPALAASGNTGALNHIAQHALDHRISGSVEAVKRVSEVAAGENRPTLDHFLHGICVTGDCGTGGEIKNGRHQAVWRQRACGMCRHRCTGPMYLPGLINRYNLLGREIFVSVQKSFEISKLLDETPNDGNLRSAFEREDQYRRNLKVEHKAEFYRIKQYEAMERKSEAERCRKDNVVFAAEEFWEKTSLGLVEVHPFAHLQMLIHDLQILPSVRFDYPAEIELEWERSIKSLARAGRFEDVLYRMEPNQRRLALLKLGDVVLEQYPRTDDLNALLDRSFAGDTVEELVDMAGFLGSELIRYIQ